MSEPRYASSPDRDDNELRRTPSALWAIILAFVAVAVVYSIVVPPFETPDEIWHFAFIHHLAAGEGLPVSQANTEELWQQQGVQAPGYYLVAAALTSWIDQSDFAGLYARANPHAAIGVPDAAFNRNYLIHHRQDGWPWARSILALHLARLFSIVLGATTVWASYQAVAPILGRVQALVGVAVFAFVPQFVFISAAASNDNAVNALAALVLWRLVILITRVPQGSRKSDIHIMRRDFLTIGVLLGVALLTKLSALGLLALAGLAVVVYAWRRRTLRPILEAVIWIGVPVMAISGWWYLRNWRLYGDPLAWNVWQANILLRVDTAGWRTILSELTSLERSFWGLFGWLNVAYPDLLYLLFRAIAALIAFGWTLSAARWLIYDRSVDIRWLGALLLILWLVLLAISWLRFMRIAPAAQGRYFYPAAPTIAMLIAIGVSAWRVSSLNRLLVGLMFAISIVTPFWIIAPAYRPPAGVEAAEMQPAGVNLGDRFTILALDAPPERLQPGQQATVRIEWRADNPPAVDYSVFVHLVDENGLIVAQRDTMPGGGLYPTSEWDRGEVRGEDYTVELPAAAYTPNRARWRVGLYDADTGVRLPVSAEATMPSDADITLLADAVEFGRVEIAAPAGSLPNPVGADFQDNLTLAGYEFNGRRLVPGEELIVTLYWQARDPVEQDYVSFVHLLDADQAMHGGDDDLLDPISSSWSKGEIVRDDHRFVVPESASPGVYLVEVGLYSRPDFDRLLLEDASGAEGADRLLLGPIRILEP